MVSTSLTTHWAVNPPSRPLRTTTPWFSLWRRSQTSTKSNNPSSSCTESRYRKLTLWSRPMARRRPTSSSPVTWTPSTLPTRLASCEHLRRSWDIYQSFLLHWPSIHAQISITITRLRCCLPIRLAAEKPRYQLVTDFIARNYDQKVWARDSKDLKGANSRVSCGIGAHDWINFCDLVVIVSKVH
jgi:hypothetical protein